MMGTGTLIYDEDRGIYGILLAIEGVTPRWGTTYATIFVLATTPGSDFTAGVIEEELSIDDETRIVTWPEVKAKIQAASLPGEE